MDPSPYGYNFYGTYDRADRQFEYPSPPRFEYEWGTDAEGDEPELSPSKRPRLDLSEQDSQDDEDDAEEQEADEEARLDADEPEAAEYPGEDNESFASSGSDAAAAAAAKARKPKRRPKKSRAGHKDDVWKRSKSEIYGLPRRDEQGRRLRKKSRRDTYEETPELRRLTGLVTKAYLSGDYEVALRFALEGIEKQPEAFQLHGTMSEILIKLGRPQDAINVLFAGVHASKESANWWFVVDRLNEINSGRNDETIKEKLRYCYSAIISLDPKDYQARFMRMSLYREKELYRRARNDCLLLLKLKPNDASVVEALAEITSLLEDPVAAVGGFSDYIHSVVKTESPENTTLTWSILSSYTEMLLEADEYGKGLKELKSVSRWLLGRAEETFWDAYPDDREWDVYPDPRRETGSGFELGKYEEESYGLGLPLELRVRLGSLRLLCGEGHYEEAMSHFDYLIGIVADEESKKEDYVDLFREAADYLRETGHHEDALRFYHTLKQYDSELDSRFYFNLAICHQALGQKEEMRLAVQSMKYGDRNPDMQIGLAKIYKSQGRLDLMWRLCLELIKMGFINLVREAGMPTTRPEELTERDENVPLPMSFSRIRTKRLKKFTKKQYYSGNALQRKQEELVRDQVIRAMYDAMQSLQDDISDGDGIALAEWMRFANEIFDEFRSYTKFFPADPKVPFSGPRKDRVAVFAESADDPGSDAVQWETERSTTWRDIALDDLVDLLCQYALYLAHGGDDAIAFSLLDLLEQSNIVFNDTARRYQVKTVLFHCAIYTHNHRKCFECVRWFYKYYAYAADCFRLISVVHRVIRGNRKDYSSGPEQKFYLRQVKTFDFELLTPEEREKFKFATVNRHRPIAVGPEQSIKDHNPDLLALYGHMMLVGGASDSALRSYYRAYVLRPNDAILNLCIALGYLTRAWKRQSTNRQVMLQHAFSFLNRYRELRCGNLDEAEDLLKLQEVELNEALVYASLGQESLAVPRLEKALVLGKRLRHEWEHGSLAAHSTSGSIIQSIEAPPRQELREPAAADDFGPEAAYTLRNIFASNGNVHKAQELTKEWLVM